MRHAIIAAIITPLVVTLPCRSASAECAPEHLLRPDGIGKNFFCKDGADLPALRLRYARKRRLNVQATVLLVVGSAAMFAGTVMASLYLSLNEDDPWTGFEISLTTSLMAVGGAIQAGGVVAAVKSQAELHERNDILPLVGVRF